VGLWAAAILAIAAATGGILGSAAPQAAAARAAAGDIRREVQQASGPVKAFYADRDYRPIRPADPTGLAFAQAVLRTLSTAPADNLDPERLGTGRLAQLVRSADQDKAASAKAEVFAAEALSRYVAALKTPRRDLGIAYTPPMAEPRAPPAVEVLAAVAAAENLEGSLAALRRMNPIYEDLRDALQSPGLDPSTRLLLRANLERARALPHDARGRYILVDAAAQELILFEGRTPRDRMRVVVGKRQSPTPMMAGAIQYVVLDPYWNVPVDLVRDTIAPAVLTEGHSVLEARRMEVLSDWSDSAKPVDPAIVDWNAVAEGRYRLRVRQLPGADNMMGRVKFMLPNTLGIYLHDTPAKSLLKEPMRMFSSGCVRLEDAERLRNWLGVHDHGGEPDRRLNLASPVPVYISYFTIAATPRGLHRRPDIYARDRPLLSSMSQTPNGLA
jgi:L,D-transpeptidase YcbB